MDFDILIFCHNKDFNKLSFVLESIKENINGYHKIYVISPIKIDDENNINHSFENILDDEVFILDDETKLKWDKWSSEKSFKRQSSNWIKQQLMKLFNNVSEKDYLIIDSDLIITKPLQIYNGDTINFFLGNNQNNYEYFNFSKKMIGLDREYNHSFISEIMYIKKDITNNILDNFFNSNFSNFVSKTIDNLSDDSFISEYEFYGNYVVKYFNNQYSFKHLNSKLNGKHSHWNNNEIEDYIKNNKNLYDLITIHSWI
jgi:hypothetical protein